MAGSAGEGSKVTPGSESEMQEVTGAGTHFDPHEVEPVATSSGW